MTYQTVATFSQVTSLLMFIAMFVGVLVYALWPSNGRRFEAAQRARSISTTTQTGGKVSMQPSARSTR